MWMHVTELRDFYHSSLGQMALRLIRQRIRDLWPDGSGLRMLGFGYPTPFLRPFMDEAERVLAFMPASQGVVHWPREGAGMTALTDDLELPLPDLSVDRVLLVHALEQSEHVRSLLREVWRVLDDSGRVMVVVPNRSGVWARLESTPFGHGRPYSITQLRNLMRDNLFLPEESARVLYMPPIRWRMAISAAPALDRIGQRWFPQLAGVNILVAGKEMYAARVAGSRRARAGRRVYAPVAEPRVSRLNR
jgi:SAM-dependent methyltransferase